MKVSELESALSVMLQSRPNSKDVVSHITEAFEKMQKDGDADDTIASSFLAGVMAIMEKKPKEEFEPFMQYIEDVVALGRKTKDL